VTIALNKIGAITIPATHLLSTKDVIYRNNAADIKMIVCVPDPEVYCSILKNQRANHRTLKLKVVIDQGTKRLAEFYERDGKTIQKFLSDRFQIRQQ